MTSTAACGIRVPGPNTAATPFADHPLTVELATALMADVDRDVLRAIHPALPRAGALAAASGR